MAGHGDMRTGDGLVRRLDVVSGLLLLLDVGLTALFYDSLPDTIAVHWSASGVADSAGHRDLIWLGPMCLAFIVALGLVSRRHTKLRERRPVAAVVSLGSLYLFSLNLLALLANAGNDSWQQGSVARGWVLLALTLPALVFCAAAALFAHRVGGSRR